MIPSDRKAPRRCALLALAVHLGTLGCSTNATIVPEDATARVERVPGEGAYRWEPERGWLWPRYGEWGVADHIREEAMQAYRAKAYADALAGFLALAEKLPATDAVAAENLFYIAESYYALKDYDKAVDYFTQVYRNGKSTPENTTVAHQRIYDIAIDYLNERAACSRLGVRYDCPRRGVDLLVGEDGLITEYRNLEFADDAIIEVAKHYVDQKQYPEAVPFYEQVVREYCPRQSEWCELAAYQLGLTTFKQVRGIDYDEAVLLDAERKFRSYLQAHPRGANAEAAREHLRQIADMLAERYLKVAKYYLRESQPRSARIYLSLVVDRYSSSSAAREARQMQGRLDGLVETDSGGVTAGETPGEGG